VKDFLQKPYFFRNELFKEISVPISIKTSHKKPVVSNETYIHPIKSCIKEVVADF